jgi:signal-transduction protein with cAMP-binding, CBS, and nucleotidyltransferase domain
MKPISLKNFAKMAVKAGDVIYSVNDASHSVYLVHSGSVQIESKQGMVLGVLNERLTLCSSSWMSRYFGQKWLKLTQYAMQSFEDSL